MPSHDPRRQIDPKAKPTLEKLSSVAGRYGVSLTAAVLRWLKNTERPSLIVFSTEGYLLWGRSSDLVWFDEEVEEFTVHATAFDQVISVLHIGDTRLRWAPRD